MKDPDRLSGSLARVPVAGRALCSTSRTLVVIGCKFLAGPKEPVSSAVRMAVK